MNLDNYELDLVISKRKNSPIVNGWFFLRPLISKRQ